MATKNGSSSKGHKTRETAFVESGVSPPFRRLNTILSKWFYKPDLQAIRIVLGTIQSHYLNLGDPAWLFLVAPPSTGKTVSFQITHLLHQITHISEITANTFLSGFHGHKAPGLLEQLGEPVETPAPNGGSGKTCTTEGDAVLLFKDFTTILSMGHDQQKALLGQLRDMHDGRYSKRFGTGITKAWKGRITVVAAVTPAIEGYRSVFNSLGERFFFVRWPRQGVEAAVKAIDQQGHEKATAEALQAAAQPLFAKATKTTPIVPKTIRTRIAYLAEFVCFGRTHVERDPHSRAIRVMPSTEGPGRLAKGLAALAQGLASLHRRTEVTEDDFQDVLRAGLDTLPVIRWAVLKAIINGADPHAVQLAEGNLTRSLRYQALQDLFALGLVDGDEPEMTMQGGLVVTGLSKKTRDLIDVIGIEGFVGPKAVTVKYCKRKSFTRLPKLRGRA